MNDNWWSKNSKISRERALDILWKKIQKQHVSY